jgi:DNA segregation ATPase FtsK/SpoIIIE-like protein
MGVALDFALELVSLLVCPEKAKEIEASIQRYNNAPKVLPSSDGTANKKDEYCNNKQFLDAVEVAVSTGKISTALIQRKLAVGYGKAAMFIDIMEDMGIVGEASGQKPREVLITPDEWHKMLECNKNT